jgi:hypothetical protein
VFKFDGEGRLLISTSCNQGCMEDNIKDRKSYLSIAPGGHARECDEWLITPLFHHDPG